MYTKQEIYTKVSNHLLAQNEKSIIHDFYKYRGLNTLQYKYRGLNTLQCAIGCLIPNDLYNEDMEGCTVYQLFDEFPEVTKKLFNEKDIDFLGVLQDIHDSIDISNWNNRLELLAISNNLDY